MKLQLLVIHKILRLELTALDTGIARME